MPVITISRQHGSLGYEIAQSLSAQLGMELIEREKVIKEWMPEVADKYQLHLLAESPGAYLKKSSGGIVFKEFIEQRLRLFASENPCIIVGLGSQMIFRSDQAALNVRIMASEEKRAERLSRKYKLNTQEALKLINAIDKRHKRYISLLYEADWADPSLYDLTINTDRLSIKNSLEAIQSAAIARGLLSRNFQRSGIPAGPSLSEGSISDSNGTAALTVEQEPSAGTAGEIPEAAPPKNTPHFKHPAETEFAGILDMYGIKWVYEPKTFPVSWDAEGNVTLAISPDFYLPSFDTYIEITTMDQKYVTTKNKKIKRLRELYPGININIVYKKDFASLVSRFGIKILDNAVAQQ
ncbi:MAG: cytidylate kinase family protein [Eubacteriales bacterium]|nr:cytidylate kinase family protein [Eubacteriales bacterium]